MKTTFCFVRPYLVGSPEKYSTAFESDLEQKSTREEAQRYGLRTLGHDDFWVGEMKDGKFVALYSGDKKRDDMNEVDGVNNEFGM